MAYPTENEMLNALEKRIGKQLLSKFQSPKVATCKSRNRKSAYN